MLDNEMLIWINETIEALKKATQEGKIKKLDNENLKLLDEVLQYCRERVLTAVVTMRIKNSPEIKEQIKLTIEGLSKKKQNLGEKLKDKQGRKEKIETFNKDNHVMKSFFDEINADEIKSLKKEIAQIQSKIKRCDQLIRNFGNPNKFIGELIGDDEVKNTQTLFTKLSKILIDHGIDGGFTLITKREDGEELNVENIIQLVNLALNQNVVDELIEVKRKVDEIKDRNSTEKEQNIIHEYSKKDEFLDNADGEIRPYIDDILNMHQIIEELEEINEEEVNEEVNTTQLKKIFVSKKRKQQLKDRQDRKDKLQKAIDELCGVGENDKDALKIREYIRKIWNDRIEMNEIDPEDEKKYECIPEEQREELSKVLRYLDSSDDKGRTVLNLYQVAQDDIRSDIDEVYDELDKADNAIYQKEKNKRDERKKLEKGLSKEVKNAMKMGFDLDRASDVIRLNKDFSSENKIVPPVVLLALGKMINDPIDLKRTQYQYTKREQDEMIKKLTTRIIGKLEKYNIQNNEIEL